MPGSEAQSSEAGEAVCFTAGPEGAAFGAGVIHAWIAADRKAPRVVSGISTGAITAAAFQRSMMERGHDNSRTEATRWGWFRQYLTDILDRPLDVIWKAIPDPVDLLSPTAPVRDLSRPDVLKEDECVSRYQFWLLTKLGSWISKLTVSIGSIGRLAVLKVRRDEQIPVPFLGRGLAARAWRNVTFNLAFCAILFRLLGSIILHPQFTRTLNRFRYDDAIAEATTAQSIPGWPGFRPLSGWAAWLFGLLLAAFATAIIAIFPLLLVFGHFQWAAAYFVAVASLFAPQYNRTFRARLKEIADRMQPDGRTAPARTRWYSRLFAAAQRNAGIELSLISNYQLKRRIWNRFQDANHPDKLRVRSSGKEETSIVIVAAVLQSLSSSNQQTWARDGAELVEALTAACAIPRFFKPLHVESRHARLWIRKKDQDGLRLKGRSTQEFDLIDGSAVRKNPLPALFNWLQDEEQRSVAEALESGSPEDARIHVIYNVPIEPFDAYDGKEPPDRIDLVEAAQVGMLMRARRDTSTEVLQTNFLSSINCAEKSVRNSAAPRHVKDLAIFADEIAPEREVKFTNPLSPGRDEELALTAQGCRRTLGRLYRVAIARLPSLDGTVDCGDLLRTIAPARKKAQCMGLAEVCGACTGRLRAYPQPPNDAALVQADFGQATKNVRAAIPNLCNVDRPRIVFVASGGVFRGAFHIGLVAAMQVLRITPDLVVGASVGTLMGAALANIRNAGDPVAQHRALAALSDTFLHVDEEVALTVPVKTAVKQLGLRAKRISLSPAKLRKTVRAGTRKDIGYAATGVPPIVIDTLSDLFIIPPRDTILAGSDFIAGRFSKAIFALVVLMRENTLGRLGIRYAVIGTSLLERAARVLLGGTQSGVELAQRQPYLAQNGSGTAIFCTTAFVNQRWPLLLGRDALEPAVKDFNFLYAALSSSAFPGAFSPRQEAEVFPGTGKTTNLFCDGGTFDNLPFIPAIDLLKDGQVEAFRAAQNQDARAFLKHRLDCPDIILSGGFDPPPADEHRPRFESQNDVAARANALGNSVKTQSFIGLSRVSQRRLRDLYHSTEGMTSPDETMAKIMTHSVVAEVVNIVPSSELHINPTFAFSRAVGFQKERVAASIADGCFQTLLNLRIEHGNKSEELKQSLRARGIDPGLGKMHEPGGCPWFQVRCPFVDAAAETKFSSPRASKGCSRIYDSCAADPLHERLFRIEKNSNPGTTGYYPQTQDARPEPDRSDSGAFRPA